MYPNSLDDIVLQKFPNAIKLLEMRLLASFQLRMKVFRLPIALFKVLSSCNHNRVQIHAKIQDDESCRWNRNKFLY